LRSATIENGGGAARVDGFAPLGAACGLSAAAACGRLTHDVANACRLGQCEGRAAFGRA